MSYEIVKSISHRKKDNKVFITSACNNVWPRHFSKWEFMPDKNNDEENQKNKELYLFHGIIGNSLQLSGSVNEKWRYAENKFYEYCRENNIDTYELWDLPYKDGEKNIEALKPYYEIFKGFLEEKKEGKYYLDSSLGIITKVNQKSFDYTPYNVPSEKYCKNFKKIYNDYSNINKENRERFNIEIKEYILDKNIDDSIVTSKEDMELAI